MDANAAIAKKYVDALKGDTIDSQSLTKIPELVSCNDWVKVEILGHVDYISERTKAHYNGILVRYNGGLYFVKQNIVKAIENLDSRFRKAPRPIKVV